MQLSNAASVMAFSLIKKKKNGKKMDKNKEKEKIMKKNMIE